MSRGELLRKDPSTAVGQAEQERNPKFHAAGLAMTYDALDRTADAERALAELERSGAEGVAYRVRSMGILARAYSQLAHCQGDDLEPQSRRYGIHGAHVRRIHETLDARGLALICDLRRVAPSKLSGTIETSAA